MQGCLPVPYAAKALCSTQQAYSEIKKEALAIVFGCERFHQFIFGKSVTVESHHKPLETIFKKPLYVCLTRMRLMQYDVKVVYKPRKELYSADALSSTNLSDF